ncbi:MAG: glycosyltransferase family 1 protein [Actinomycetota bacterium]
MRIGLDARDALRRESGISTLTMFLCRALAEIESGDDFFQYLDVFEGDGPSNPGLVTGGGFHTRVLPGSRQVWKQIRLPAALRRDRIDVFHSMTSTIPFVRPCPTAVTVCDLFFEAHPEFAPSGDRFKMRRLYKYAARNADRIIAISKTTKQDLIKFYGVNEDKISVIYPAPNPFYRILNQAEDAEKSKAVMLSHSLEPPFLLHVGGMTKNRNIAGMLDAVSLLKKTGIRPKLVLIGRSFWGFDLKAELAKRLLCDEVIEIKYAPGDDLRILYNQATALLLPSLYEGFGLPILEAMACGTPVITSNLSAMPEAAGDAALLVDPLDPSAIAAAIEQIMGDKTLRDTLISKGLKQVERFTWPANAAQTLEVYHSLANV